MNTKTLSPELLHNMDAYWRAAKRNWSNCYVAMDGRPTSLRVTNPP